MICKDTLVIHHFPPKFSVEETTSFLKYFGATQVKKLDSKVKKTSLVFAKFKTEAAANITLHRLHQLDVLGYLLTVEYARSKEAQSIIYEEREVSPEMKTKEKCEMHFHKMLNKLNEWSTPLNFPHLPPLHLKYDYPPPTSAIIYNISQSLMLVPKLYYQVLHLMNKMNLPSPFESYFPESNLSTVTPFSNDPVIHQASQVQEMPTKTQVDVLSNESELESDEESGRTAVQVKRVLSQKQTHLKKRKYFKLPLTTSLTPVKIITNVEEIFDKVDVQSVQGKIEVKLNQRTASTGQFEIASANKKIKENDGITLKEMESSKKEITRASSVITPEELAANRIPIKDLKLLPVFKNYQPGSPSCRLYIKNISKQVVERDLHWIYRRYIEHGSDAQAGMLNIQLMKEGRMKGQAFITFQDMKQAQLALKDTNGFILKDKPLVVQFARSAKTN